MEIIGGNIYTENEVTQELVDMVNEKVKSNGCTRVFFNVTGRTCHMLLSKELSEKVKDYDVEISHNYGCKVFKKGWIDYVDNSFTTVQLKEMAKKLKIKGSSNMNKYYLMVLINDEITLNNSKL